MAECSGALRKQGLLSLHMQADRAEDCHDRCAHKVPTKCNFNQIELIRSITEAGGRDPFFVSSLTVGGLMEATHYFQLAASSDLFSGSRAVTTGSE